MIRFFQTPQKTVIATKVNHALNEQEINELNWLYGEAELLDAEELKGYFVGPRREMVTPWSTNASRNISPPAARMPSTTRCCNACTTA